MANILTPHQWFLVTEMGAIKAKGSLSKLSEEDQRELRRLRKRLKESCKELERVYSEKQNS